MSLDTTTTNHRLKEQTMNDPERIEEDRNNAIEATDGDARKAAKELDEAAHNVEIPMHVRIRWSAAAATLHAEADYWDD